ncbi:lantibiotic dehydratase [Streptomyces durbertensis]|uniref:Lantibiotic dehydratase n=1 Tax=Streptomyces durbertensis TaxID=2448886 RepID=A0ABR6EI52_9ACTN|nr:lantibiotic dehydratase [Streptomyces durbertensis]MBB1245013.1 lantibiotic dehydratase [Streptomyces durbertensis]
MRSTTHPTLFQHAGSAVLRAAATPLTSVSVSWPNLDNEASTRDWLRQRWSDERVAEAVGHAAPRLAERVRKVCEGRPISPARLRRIALSLSRYLLRTASRPTPFGLFAGAAAVTVGGPAHADWSEEHTSAVRVDAQWLLDVVSRLESVPGLLERLPVVFTNLTVRRGGQLEVPHGPDRVAVRATRAVEVVRAAAASPIGFSSLAEHMAGRFPESQPYMVHGMLTELVRRGLLITALRTPLTVRDPLTHVVDTLRTVHAETVPGASVLLTELEAVRTEVHGLQHAVNEEQGRTRAHLAQRMRRTSAAGRTPISVDLRLSCDLQLPERVVREAERAASALLRLGREPTGPAAWREYFTAFCERYGTGTLVPVTEAVHPDAGLGYPAGYPNSTRPEPRPVLTRRDERLAALAWRALATGEKEIILTDAVIDTIAEDLLDERYIPPHVEVSVRVQAADAASIDRGDFALVVSPGRAAGTFTARFTDIVPEVAEVYRKLPTVTAGALPAQLSVPPIYPHAENICRTRAFLPHVIALGEHRPPGTNHEDVELIRLDDLALTATRERLHLVSMSRRQVVEPQVFHALAIEKQLPPLARFLLQVPRGGLAAWTEFDWGPHADLPYLPRVRYHRSVLSPARWRLTRSDLGTASSTDARRFRDALAAWRHRWKCPPFVELRDDDRTLRLDLGEATHAALVLAHLDRYGTARLTETDDTSETLGWIGGHAHEVALPLSAARPPAPDPLTGSLPRLTNQQHGQLPAHPDARWLHAQIPTHPERMAEIITDHLPRLLATLSEDCPWWFVRYRSPHESDHLRLRLRTREPHERITHTVALADWAQTLREQQLAGPLTVGTYLPETGRYGTDTVTEVAEAVFAADSTAVAAQLRHLPDDEFDPLALTAAGMVATARGLLGHHEAMRWLQAHPAPVASCDRAVTDQALRLVEPNMAARLPVAVARAWQVRDDALAAYCQALPPEMDLNVVLESLLHMHHNRQRGIDREGEAVCRRLARQTAVTWAARHDGFAR